MIAFLVSIGEQMLDPAEYSICVCFGILMGAPRVGACGASMDVTPFLCAW